MPRKPKCDRYRILIWILMGFPVDYMVYEQDAHINSINAMINSMSVYYVESVRDRLRKCEMCEIPEERINKYVEFDCNFNLYYNWLGYSGDVYDGYE